MEENMMEYSTLKIKATLLYVIVCMDIEFVM